MMRTTTPILSILIAILLFFFFTHPQYLKMVDLDKQIGEYQEATNTYKEFLTKLEEKFTAKTSRSAYDIERLSRLIPDEIDATQYLVDLEALAERHNMLFGNTSIDDASLTLTKGSERDAKEKVSKSELMTVDISFEVVGRYDQFKDFLSDLESSLTIFEVTGITFSVVEGPFQQFAVTVRTYALPSK